MSGVRSREGERGRPDTSDGGDARLCLYVPELAPPKRGGGKDEERGEKKKERRDKVKGNSTLLGGLGKKKGGESFGKK